MYMVTGNIRGLGIMAVLVSTTYGVSAATRENMQRLDAAYPPGGRFADMRKLICS